MAAKLSLEQIRQTLDKMDSQIVELLVERFSLGSKVQAIKSSEGLEEGDSFARLEREEQIFKRVAALVDDRMDPEPIVSVYREIISVMLEQEQKQRIAWLGPSGTFSELAARRRFGSRTESVPCKTIPEVFRAVANNAAHWGVLPFENKSEGPVNETFDHMVEHPSLYVVGEVVVPVELGLLATSEIDLADVQTVRGHPQALAQCANWLATNMPHAVQQPSSSNGAAAEAVASAPQEAAIGPEQAAQIWGLQVLRHNLEDNTDNSTRFAIVGRRLTPPSGDDRSLLVLSIRDGPRSLYEVLEVFAGENINLTMLHSRPLRPGGAGVRFYLELSGHCDDPAVSRALAAADRITLWQRLLGSFPVGA